MENVLKNNIFNVRETHLTSHDEISKKLKNFDHLYHILATHATPEDKRAGILLFINKTENLLKSEELHTGRRLYAQTQNKITNDIKNIFSFYAKSHTTKADVKCIFEKIRKLVCENELKNVCGD